MTGQSMTCFQHRIHLNCTPGSAGAYLGTVQIWIWKSPQLKNTLAVLEQNQEKRNTTATCLFLQIDIKNNRNLEAIAIWDKFVSLFMTVYVELVVLKTTWLVQKWK